MRTEQDECVAGSGDVVGRGTTSVRFFGEFGRDGRVGGDGVVRVLEEGGRDGC